MKEIDDEELQRLIEQQMKQGAQAENTASDDEKLYRAVFAALATAPPVPAADGSLANHVVGIIEAEQEKKESTKYNFAIGASIVGGLLLSLVSALFVSPAILASVAAHKWIILFIISSVVLIQYFDQKLIHHRFGKGKFYL